MFQKGKTAGLDRAEKTTKEIAEISGTGLRTVQSIIKNWKESEESQGE